jgi:hypothetical protein
MHLPVRNVDRAHEVSSPSPADIEYLFSSTPEKKFWKHLDLSDLDRFQQIWENFLTRPETLESDDVVFFLKTHRYRRRARLDVPFAIFLATFDWIGDPIVSHEAFELIICTLREQPDFGPLFVRESHDRGNTFISLFEHPDRFGGWTMTAADRLIEACGQFDIEPVSFFRDLLMSILKGFSENPPDAQHWISVFSVFAKLVQANVLDEVDVSEILRACTIAASNPIAIEPAFQHAFACILRCVSTLLATDLAFPPETIQFFVASSTQLLNNLDPRRATALVALFQFVCDVVPLGVDPIVSGFLRPLPDGSGLEIRIAYLALVTETLRRVPEAPAFLADHPEIIAMAVDIRARGSFAQRMASIGLFLVLIDVEPVWPRIFVECSVLEELAELLLAADSLSWKKRLADALLKVAQWAVVNPSALEMIEAFAGEPFAEILQGIEDHEDGLLREQLAALGEMIHSGLRIDWPTE